MAKISKSDHPATDKLLAFVSGFLSDVDSLQIEKHLAGCDDCGQLLKGICENVEDEIVAHIQDALKVPRVSHSADQSRRIDNYKLLQKIGEGGMGEVWMAEQISPVRRQVALKLVQPRLNTKQVIARFEAERQALSMMDHPNIAKVLDAGATDNGNPYFVMELVNGIPLVEYCDERNFNVRQRLELFVSICCAVHHAHQKGVIHRDLKPSNILITQYDGEPVPKVIDFGLAKAMNKSMRLTDKTIYTEFGKVVGTLNYMSPEQAEMNSLDVDTRTDIYSLGVILYELLTGTTPVEEDKLRNTAFLKVLEIIRENDPPTPSVRLSNSNTAKLIGEKRNMDINTLQRTLSGELEWIVMKSLAKNRNRRFDSASSFADDISRYLNDEQVLARPATRRYLMHRFIRKNSGLIATVVVVFSLLLFGVLASSYFAIQASRAAHRSDQVLTVVRDSFRSTNPVAGGDAGMSAKDVLDNAKQSLRHNRLDFEGEEKLLEALGDSFEGIGEYKASTEVRRDLLSLTQEKLGKLHTKTLQRKNELAIGLMRQGKVQQSMSLLEEVVPLLREYSGKFTIETLGAEVNLVANYFCLGQYPEAIDLGEQTLVKLNRRFGPDHRATMNLMSNLAGCYSATTQHENALRLSEITVDRMREHLGPNYPDTLNAQCNYAIYLKLSGDHKNQALALLDSSVQKLKSKVGLAHEYTFVSMTSLAKFYLEEGLVYSALEVANELHEFASKNYDATHHRVKSTKMLKKAIQSNAGDP